jgi:hypothetical protein
MALVGIAQIGLISNYRWPTFAPQFPGMLGVMANPKIMTAHSILVTSVVT